MKLYTKLGLAISMGLGFSAAANSAVLATTTLYDNLSATQAASQGVPPGWIADKFSTGAHCPNGCTLGNITLNIAVGFEGSLNGVVLQLYSDAGNVPGSTLIGHAYQNPALPTGFANNNVFFANPLDANQALLQNNTSYWVKLDASAPGASSVDWTYAEGDSGAWAFDTLGTGPYAKAHGVGGAFLMKVEANVLLGGSKVPPGPAAVPVPAAAWLMGSALIGMVSSWRRKKAA